MKPAPALSHEPATSGSHSSPGSTIALPQLEGTVDVVVELVLVDVVLLDAVVVDVVVLELVAVVFELVDVVLLVVIVDIIESRTTGWAKRSGFGG